MFMFYGLQEVNAVTSSKKAGIANILLAWGFGHRTCYFAKIAFNDARFPVSFQRSFEESKHLLLKDYMSNLAENKGLDYYQTYLY